MASKTRFEGYDAMFRAKEFLEKWYPEADIKVFHKRKQISPFILYTDLMGIEVSLNNHALIPTNLYSWEEVALFSDGISLGIRIEKMKNNGN